MERHFHLYLTCVLICFSLMISFAIGTLDYQKGQKQILTNHNKEIDMIGNAVVQSLHTIDQVYSLTEGATTRKIEGNLTILVEEYKQNPSIEHWDYQEIKQRFDMDFYVIDETNTVIYSSFRDDIGLNFEECCGSFAEILTQRRLGGEVKHDNLDIQQATGEIKKFGYLPTHDQKYLFEMSASLGEDEIFQRFNFIKEIERLKEEYEPIHSIHIYNPNGIALEYAKINGEVHKLANEMQTVFNKVKQTNEQQEVSRTENGSNITYRYIPYTSGEDLDYPLERVVEIVYNEIELESLLKFYRHDFFFQQIVIVVLVILLAIMIGRVVSRPIYLAFHDNLTGMRNRAAFEMEIHKRLERRQEKIALMMIDVDNFKQVNDQLGHAEGDRLLVVISRLIEKNIEREHMASRLGGDEFVVIVSNLERDEIKQIAEKLLDELNEACSELNDRYHLGVSISIGITYRKENEDLNSLYERVDMALYSAKENGKNQYYFAESKQEDD